jgi:hypothetical protein
MKKFLKAVLLLVSPMYITYGQTHQDSVSTYNELNKWAVVKLTIAYMDDFGMNEENEIQTYNNLKSKYKSYSEDIDLDSFEEALTQGWNTTKTKVYEKYKNELVDNDNKLNFKDVSFNPPGKENSRSQVLSQINKAYDSIIQLNIPHTNPKEIPVNKETEGEKPNQPLVNKGIGLFEILLYLILAVSILVNILLYLKNNLIMKKKKPRNVNQFNDFNKKNNEDLKEQNDKLRIENENLKSIIQKYSEKPFSESSKDELLINEVKPLEDEKSPATKLGVTQVLNSKKTIYLPSPFEEQKFAVEDVSENEKPTSLYVAKIDSKTSKGTISLIETANLSRALNSPELFLETVCEYENQYNSLAKGIKVINVGELCLEGQDWVVTKKIKIKFI